MEDMIFSSKQREDFINSVKTGKNRRSDILKNGMPFSDAFKYGYLDVARAPLKGIKDCLAKCGNSSPTKVRNKCISDIIVPYCKSELLQSESQEKFNSNHEILCKKIANFYKENGYNKFTIGKAQKWINMSLKYASMYDKDDQNIFKQVFKYFHVPIDRYIADYICNDLRVELPEYDGFNMPECGEFSAERFNYSWSRIDCYENYLKCQSDIKDKLGNECALNWEYEKWLEAKSEKQLKNS